MKKKMPRMPHFKSESDEADWWAGKTGRDYVERKSAEARLRGTRMEGSSLVAKLNKKTTQIAIRLPNADIAQARKIADRKGIGYHTLLKIFVREGLLREARRH